MILGALPFGLTPFASGAPATALQAPPSVATLLSRGWLAVADLSVPNIPPSALPRINRLARPPIVGEVGFTLFFNTTFASNWFGGMTFIKPSGARLVIPYYGVFPGVDPVAGALVATNEFVAHTFVAHELNEPGEWLVYLTSAGLFHGTQAGSVNAGSGAGSFVVLNRAFAL